ncbi:3-oxo-tetronate kinase [Roseovarius sp. CAU 1744]|uniref:3-oxo-tetronate kinase n=1 Tax=Roseovarius sp. CAU 1744 TaxID=3140368 RepID=UPI00325BD045
MTTVLGAIADDFTGATDLAGLLARSGVRVSLRMGAPTDPPDDTAPFEVIALKIRTAPAADAVSGACQALHWLKAAGAARFFWKYCSTFDSTPEGNIGPVAEALMAELGAEQTIYCPAFPENGRAVFMGHLFVGQEPLAESPMKDHPLTPMRDSNLVRLLQPQVSGKVGLVDRPTVARGATAVRGALARLADAGVGHVVVDAVADDDLSVIAEASRDMALITGGSALAMPLPVLCADVGALAERPEPPGTSATAIVLSGSCSAMTNRQVAAYLDSGAPAFQLDPLTLAEAGTQEVLDWLASQDLRRAPLIYATAAPDAVRAAQGRLGAARAGDIVEQVLAACARFALGAGARRFVVAGGESSGAVTQALGVNRLDVGREITPGVPWCFARSGGNAIALALKSGNFGSESFFADALAGLEAS